MEKKRRENEIAQEKERQVQNPRERWKKHEKGKEDRRGRRGSDAEDTAGTLHDGKKHWRARRIRDG